jgi:hypothetical protein
VETQVVAPSYEQKKECNDDVTRLVEAVIDFYGDLSLRDCRFGV